MEKMQHTPGPWRYAHARTPTRIVGPRDETVAAVYGGFAGEEEQAANSRIIAAAPAMYEYVAGKAGEGDEEARAIIEGFDSAGQ